MISTMFIFLTSDIAKIDFMKKLVHYTNLFILLSGEMGESKLTKE